MALTKLRSIILDDNELNGEIPSNFAQLVDFDNYHYSVLQTFSAGNNNFEGPLPSWICAVEYISLIGSTFLCPVPKCCVYDNVNVNDNDDTNNIKYCGEQDCPFIHYPSPSPTPFLPSPSPSPTPSPPSPVTPVHPSLPPSPSPSPSFFTKDSITKFLLLLFFTVGLTTFIVLFYYKTTCCRGGNRHYSEDIEMKEIYREDENYENDDEYYDENDENDEYYDENDEFDEEKNENYDEDIRVIPTTLFGELTK
uniref:Uncharacterized protein n=1 Tax=Paramoeba aestuarina TaxID=180227 RepID=A0A7S4K488_9EUKA